MKTVRVAVQMACLSVLLLGQTSVGDPVDHRPQRQWRIGDTWHIKGIYYGRIIIENTLDVGREPFCPSYPISLTVTVVGEEQVNETECWAIEFLRQEKGDPNYNDACAKKVRLWISKDEWCLEAQEALDGGSDVLPGIWYFEGVKVLPCCVSCSLPQEIIPLALADGVPRISDRDASSLDEARRTQGPKVTIIMEPEGEDSYILKQSLDMGPFSQRIEQYWKKDAGWWTRYVRYFDNRIDMDVHVFAFEQGAPVSKTQEVDGN